jgi:flagellar basal-body rod protein FlgB
MPVSDIPILAMLRTRMAWHQERQRVLANNVANKDTPNFKPRDLVPTDFSRTAPTAGLVALVRTDPMHLGIAATGGGSQFEERDRSEARPIGNQGGLEDEMMKVANNQMDYQMVTTL